MNEILKIIKDKERYKAVFFHWLPLGAATVLLCGLLYVTIQQNYRSSFNDPQIQISEDLASTLSSGKPTGQFTPQTDIEKSLATYAIIYNEKGEVLTYSGFLGDKAPVPPMGVFDSAKATGQNRITWEPKLGVRTAIVITPFKNSTISGFVLVGRNMRELEKRVKDLTTIIRIGMIVTLIATFIMDFAGDTWRRRAMAQAVPAEEKAAN